MFSFLEEEEFYLIFDGEKIPVYVPGIRERLKRTDFNNLTEDDEFWLYSILKRYRISGKLGEKPVEELSGDRGIKDLVEK